MKKYLLDLGERMFWTGAQAALALVSIEAFDQSKWWVVPVAIALAGVKGFVARKVGSPDSASTVPSVGS